MENNSLDRMTELLKKLQVFLKENGAYFQQCKIVTENDVDNKPYSAELTVNLLN